MDEEFKDVQKERIDFLLGEYDEHRAAIKEMIVDIERIREKIDVLIPTSLDARYIRYFEEKVKSMTGIFNSLLEMRKEIAKSIKDEIEIRRKIKNDDDLVDVEDMLDIRSMANKINEFQEQSLKMKEKRLKVIRDQKIDEEINIPGLEDEKGRKLKNDRETG